MSDTLCSRCGEATCPTLWTQWTDDRRDDLAVFQVCAANRIAVALEAIVRRLDAGFIDVRVDNCGATR